MNEVYLKSNINEELIIGRIKEKAELDLILNSPDPELFFLYGRRRIGKTFLIHNYCGSKGLYFYFRAEEDSTMKFSINNFYKEIIDAFHKIGIAIIKPTITNWTDAFDFFYAELEKHKDKKIIILFDEFPWYCTSNSKFLKCFSYFWNKQASNYPNIKIFCTGSATSFLINKVIKDKKGLFSRLKSKKMSPFTLSETSKFLHNRKIYIEKQKDIVMLYMVFGGVPQYLKEIKQGQSVEEIINRCFCGKSPIFGLEFNELFQGTFSNFELHKKIVEFIRFSKKGKTKTEINSFLTKEFKNKYNGTQKKTALEDLVASDLVAEVYLFSLDKRTTGQDSALYKLSDEFLLFYSYWLDGNKMITNADYWSKESKSRDISTWAGEVFERVCIKHIDEIFKKIGINCNIYPHWWKNFKDPDSKEIDILVDREDNKISIIEIKYYEDKYFLDRAKREAVNSKKVYFDLFKSQEPETQHNRDNKLKDSNIIFITASGMEKNNHYNEIPISNHFKMTDLL